jgi:hypothetical protein
LEIKFVPPTFSYEGVGTVGMHNSFWSRDLKRAEVTLNSDGYYAVSRNCCAFLQYARDILLHMGRRGGRVLLATRKTRITELIVDLSNGLTFSLSLY